MDFFKQTNEINMNMNKTDMEYMEDFEKKYNKKGDAYFVWFYANWCGHCKVMIDSWNEFVAQAKKQVPHVKVLKIESEHINSKHNVTGFPTIRLYKNGKIIEYSGDRTPEDFLKFIKDQKINAYGKKKSKHNKKTKKAKKGGRKKTKKSKTQ